MFKIGDIIFDIDLNYIHPLLEMVINDKYSWPMEPYPLIYANEFYGYAFNDYDYRYEFYADFFQEE